MSRPAVPEEVKRQLRQEAGFGCCRCGHPFIQYHHIVPWAEDQHFRPEDMMVLCGQCHPLCTVDAIPQKEQRALKSRPKNIIDKQTRGQLFVNTNELIVNIGGGQAIETPTLLEIARKPVLGARLDREDGRVLISAMIHDDLGNVVGKIIDNEWLINPTEIWDFDAAPMRVKIRLAPREITFRVDVRKNKVNLQGKWFYNKNRINFSNREIKYGDSTFHCGVSYFNNALIVLGWAAFI